MGQTTSGAAAKGFVAMQVRSEPSVSLLERLTKALRNWLICSDPLQPAELIFVLAGRRNRKAYGVELLRRGWAQGILLSTLSADSLDLSRFAELQLPAWPRLLELQGRIPSEGRLFFLHYDGASWQAQCLPVRPLGTLNEIWHFANWLREHPRVRSALIVSAGLHLRRIRMCCRALLPEDVKFLLVEAPPDAASGSAVQSTGTRHEDDPLSAEYAKLFLYRIALAVRSARERSLGVKKSPAILRSVLPVQTPSSDRAEDTVSKS